MQIELQEWIGLSPAMFLYAVVAIGVAAFIRGYSGFGFSALTVTSLSMILPPAEVVPSAFMLEIAASIHTCCPWFGELLTGRFCAGCF